MLYKFSTKYMLLLGLIAINLMVWFPKDVYTQPQSFISVYDFEDFQEMMSEIDSRANDYDYRLMDDIICTSQVRPAEEFTGTLNGLNHTIWFLDLKSSGNISSLFKETDGATIKNIVLESPSFSQVEYRSCFAKVAYNTNFYHCYVYGLDFYDIETSGVFGVFANSMSFCTIDDCGSYGTVTWWVDRNGSEIQYAGIANHITNTNFWDTCCEVEVTLKAGDVTAGGVANLIQLNSSEFDTPWWFGLEETVAIRNVYAIGGISAQACSSSSGFVWVAGFANDIARGDGALAKNGILSFEGCIVDPRISVHGVDSEDKIESLTAFPTMSSSYVTYNACECAYRWCWEPSVEHSQGIMYPTAADGFVNQVTSSMCNDAVDAHTSCRDVMEGYIVFKNCTVGSNNLPIHGGNSASGFAGLLINEDKSCGYMSEPGEGP